MFRHVTVNYGDNLLITEERKSMSDLCTCGHDRDGHGEDGCELDCDCTWFHSVKEL